MISGTSLFKKALIANDIKRFWRVSALYALILLLVLPVHHLLQTPEDTLNDTWKIEQLRNSLRFTGERFNIQVILLCVIPVLLAVLIQRYMQNSRSAAVIHGLPVSRSMLYVSHNTAGLLLLCAPILLTGGVLMILQPSTFLREYYSFTDVMTWLGLALLFAVLFYAFTVFVGMFTGNSTAQIVFTYILHIVPAGLYYLVNYNLQQLLLGYDGTNVSESFIIRMPLPAITIRSPLDNGFTFLQAAVYLLVTLLLLMGAGFFYRIRKIEAAGDLISFPAVRPVFKYGVAFCCTLLGGSYFGSISQDSFAAIVAGYLASSFAGYWIAEMLMQKSLRVWKAYRGYLVYAALILLFTIGIAADVTGYVHRIPDIDQIQKVWYGSSIIRTVSDDGTTVTNGYDSDNFFTSEQSIRNVRELHAQIVKSRPASDNSYTRYVAYYLKNGKYLIRRYDIDESLYAARLRPIYESMDYKRYRFPVLTQAPEYIKSIEIRDDRTDKRTFILSDEEEIREFTKQLRQDIVKTTYEELSESRDGYVRLQVVPNDKQTGNPGWRIDYDFRNSYTATLDWLRQKNYYNSILLLPEEVTRVTLSTMTVKSMGSRGWTAKQDEAAGWVEITDTAVIRELMASCVRYLPNRKTKVVQMNFIVKGNPGQHSFQGYLSPDAAVSAKLKGYIDRLGKK